MKILVLSDHVVDTIYSPNVRDRFGDVDLLFSCGDLPYSYMEYVVTMLSVPAFYVHGNHDRLEYTDSGTVLKESGGWTNLDGQVMKAEGLILAGLEGSPRYRPDAPYQYTEAGMWGKALRLLPALLRNRLLYGRYLDVLVAHAPPRRIHDGEDLPHRGFVAFRWLMTCFRPRYLFHGHKHVYGPQETRTRYRTTTVVNAYPYTVVEWE